MIANPLATIVIPFTTSRLRRSIFVATCLVAVLAFFGQPGFAQTGLASRELFDGKTLKGWEGDLDYWRVEQGAIIGEIPQGQSLRKNTWLVWRGGEVANWLTLNCGCR